MNLLVLFLCNFILQKKVLKKKIVVAAFCVTLLQCILLLLPAGGAKIKQILGFGGGVTVTIWMLFKPRGIDACMKVLFALCGGAIILGGTIRIIRIFFGFLPLSFWYLWFWGSVGFFLIRMIWSRFWPRKSRIYVQVKLFFTEEESINCLALVDSGNSLLEPISKEPVSLIEKCALGEQERRLMESTFRIVPFHSVGQSAGLIEAYRIRSMEICKDGEWIKVDHPFIGIVKDILSTQKSYQMILHPEIVEKVEK